MCARCACVRGAAAVYDTETTGPKRSLGHAIAASPMRYHASFESAAQRFRKVGDVNDLTYDTDTGESLDVCGEWDGMCHSVFSRHQRSCVCG